MKAEDFRKIDPAKWYKDGNQLYVNVKTINLNLDCGLCGKAGIIRIENVMIDEQTGKAAIFFNNNPLLMCGDCQDKLMKGDIESVLKKMVNLYK